MTAGNSIAFPLSPIPGDKPVHIAAHYTKTRHSINRLHHLRNF
jgi:hypothetical protein